LATTGLAAAGLAGALTTGFDTTAFGEVTGAFVAAVLTTGFAFAFTFGLTTAFGAAVGATGAAEVVTGFVSAVAILISFFCKRYIQFKSFIEIRQFQSDSFNSVTFNC
jgi:hypothetical protein